MPIGMLFWFLVLCWLVFGLWWGRADLRDGKYGLAGGNLLLFVLLLLLGWAVFGTPVK